MLARIQRLGGFLSSMVIPNIGAFIAWGLITALFIPTGWLRELGVDRARMNGDDDRVRRATTELDRRRAREHVERCL